MNILKKVKSSTSAVEIIGLLSLLVVIALLIVAGPFLVIFALNTLFPILAIGYNFWTWLSVVILSLTLRARQLKD